MSGWNPDTDMHYGRGMAESAFYWWCPQCKASGREYLLSTCYRLGDQHKQVTHG